MKKKKKIIMGYQDGGNIDPNAYYLLTPSQQTVYDNLQENEKENYMLTTLGVKALRRSQLPVGQTQASQSTTSPQLSIADKTVSTTSKFVEDYNKSNSGDSQNGKGAAIAGAGAAASQIASEYIDSKDKDANGRGTVFGQIASKTLSRTGQGAAIGSAGGPWGTLIGGVAGSVFGTVEGAITGSQQEKEAEAEQSRQKYLNDLAKYRRAEYAKGQADGGKIVGEGTGKSDSIIADVDEGSFVVPVENAKAAQALRKKYLSKKSGNADLINGDTMVKLSNGEEIFSPEEVSILRSKGIDLNSLAPKAESKLEKKNGGTISPEKAKKILHDGKVYGKPLTEKQRKFMGAMASKGMQDGGKIEDLRKPKQFFIARDAKNLKPMPIKKKADKDFLVPTGIKKDSLPEAKKEESIKGYAKAGVVTKGKSGKGLTKKMVKRPSLFVPEGTEAPEELIPVSDKRAEREAAVNRVEPTEIDIIRDKKSERKRTGFFAKAVDKIGVGALIGAGQTAVGLTNLYGENRPVDELDPTLLSQRDIAIREQNELSPFAKDALSENEATYKTQVQNIINLSSGSTGTALGNINTALSAKLAADRAILRDNEAIRMQKKERADRLSSAVSEGRRRIFEDANKAFMQNQLASADMVQAGISNVIGSIQAREQTKREEARAAMGIREGYYTPINAVQSSVYSGTGKTQADINLEEISKLEGKNQGGKVKKHFFTDNRKKTFKY